jgi:prepilin-type processing-associated H-X9-DG protein
MGSQSSSTAPLGDNWGRGNYAANAALGLLAYSADNCWYAALPGYGWSRPFIRGVMGANTSVGFAEITDGSSNTVLLGEIRAGVTDFDSRGVWAMSGGPPSALWAHGGIYGGDNGPNCPLDGGDDVISCTQIQAAFGGATGLAMEGMPCADGVSWQQTARSQHAGGVNTCFTDGSVHWISDFIQVMPSSYLNLSVWDRLMTSSDGQPVPSDAY